MTAVLANLRSRRTVVPTRRLSRTARRWVLSVHIVSSVGWIGADLALIVLMVTALGTSSGAVAAACLQAVVVVIPPMVPALALLMLTSGVVLSLGTKWGLVRYWWVAVKLVAGIVLSILVLVLLLPNALTVDVPPATGTGDQVRAAVDMTDFLMPPIVSGVALLISVWLSVARPGGRIRRRDR